jgi:hypothetical protein
LAAVFRSLSGVPRIEPVISSAMPTSTLFDERSTSAWAETGMTSIPSSPVTDIGTFASAVAVTRWFASMVKAAVVTAPYFACAMLAFSIAVPIRWISSGLVASERAI